MTRYLLKRHRGRHRWMEVAASAPNAGPNRPHNLGIGPCAESSVTIGRQVRSSEQVAIRQRLLKASALEEVPWHVRARGISRRMAILAKEHP